MKNNKVYIYLSSFTDLFSLTIFQSGVRQTDSTSDKGVGWVNESFL